MANRTVRIESISIENFKNVIQGTLDLKNKHKEYKASVLGLYGQNGSGKTALIDAIQLLKYALCGKPVPAKYADYIYANAEYAALKYQFVIHQGEDTYHAWYQFAIRKVKDETAVDIDEEILDTESMRVELFDEVLSFSYETETGKLRKAALIDTRKEELFGPKSKLSELIGDDKEDYMDLLVAKKLAKAMSKSFIFSRELINQHRKHCQNEHYRNVISNLYIYGNRELFVIDTKNTGCISFDRLPLAFQKKSGAVGRVLLSLDEPSLIPEDRYDAVESAIKNMNIVLEKLVPGLQIDVVDLGLAITEEGETKKLIQIVSLKNVRQIPFCYESEGIKKIVSVLQLLILVYNQPSFTVAIDELDSGVFEYLLGELLNIISEKGKGQLIFTSHNLRPLETIDKGFIAFTTTNPSNRYIRFANVKGTNNLRDFYYRDIVLGEQSEQIYNPTNHFEIALALREAGEAFGS